VYLIGESDTRVGEAGRLVLLRERVEGRVFGARETTEGVVESCLRCLLSISLLLHSLAAPRAVPRRTNVDRAVDGVGLDAGVGVAERYIRCCRGHGIAAEEHAPTVVSTVMAC
jgi:hypothetical protein